VKFQIADLQTKIKNNNFSLKIMDFKTDCMEYFVSPLVSVVYSPAKRGPKVLRNVIV